MFSKASFTDLDAVCALCEQVKEHLNASGIPQWDEIYPDREVFHKDIGAGNLYLLREDGALLGLVVVNQEQDEEYEQIEWQTDGQHAAVIHRLMVDPMAQGKGLARKLLAFAEQEAARRGCKVMRLDAFSLNPRALNLYEQNGYANRGSVQFRKGKFYCYEKELSQI